jgi:Bacteriocin-protection, YdeI or OmpD-Associated
MTEAGRARLPDLTLEPLQIASDIESALRADVKTWQNFQALPDVYQRIRLDHLEQTRHNRAELEKRLGHFLERTKQNKWNISEFLSVPM